MEYRLIGMPMLPITKTDPIEAARCPIRSVMSNVTGKWQVLILLALEDGELRFGQVKRTVGDISQRVLTQNLRSLEREGYLTRTVNDSSPVTVSYALTSCGHSFVECIIPVVMWSNENMKNIKKSREAYDALHGEA